MALDIICQIRQIRHFKRKVQFGKGELLDSCTVVVVEKKEGSSKITDVNLTILTKTFVPVLGSRVETQYSY